MINLIIYYLFAYFSWIVLAIILLGVLMYKTQTREILYYVWYVVLLLNIVASILFIASDFVITFFLKPIKEPVIVTDPSIFTTNYYNFLLYLTCLIALPFILTSLQFYYKQLYYKTFWKWLIDFHAYCIYILSTTFYIIKDDLHLAEWVAMGDVSDMEINLDLQPKFEIFLKMFCELYNQLLGFNILCIFIPFFLIILGKIELSMNKPKKNFFYEISLIHFLFIWGMFYEFLFSNSIVICILGWIFMLCAHLFWLFLDSHVRYKKKS